MPSGGIIGPLIVDDGRFDRLLMSPAVLAERLRSLQIRLAKEKESIQKANARLWKLVEKEYYICPLELIGILKTFLDDDERLLCRSGIAQKTTTYPKQKKSNQPFPKVYKNGYLQKIRWRNMIYNYGRFVRHRIIRRRK